MSDIEGSTALLSRVGESRYARLLDFYRDATRSATARHGGEEIDTQGDSFFVIFPSPRGAVAATLEMQRAFLAEHTDGGIRVRMGLHAGEAERTTSGLVGLEIHRAARIAATAHGGQVLLSESMAVLVRDALPEATSLTDLGHHRLKDLGRPEHIFQLDGSGLPSDFPPLRSLENPALPNNLPQQLTTFIGRARELADVRDLIAAKRLVTLTGPGGSGKTRLALQVAADMLDGTGDGVWLVELADLDDEVALPTAIATALGLSLDDDPSLDRLASALAPQRALVILDSCEHLVGGCAKVADTLLSRAPDVHLVTTSREPLGVAGETIYRVPSLTVPNEEDQDSDPRESDAVALLLDRARSQGVSVDLDQTNASLLASICRRLDGMPLAIELATARLPSLSLETLEARLDQRFRLLTGGSRNAPERQRTLRATVRWSFSALTASERTLLGRLSIFVAGFDLDAAEDVCGFGALEGLEVADLIGSLVDKSLVTTERRGRSLRYRLLETIREYAAEELVECGEPEVERTARLHADHFLAFMEELGDRFSGGDQAMWLQRLELDEPNVARAMEFAATQPDGVESLLRFGKASPRVWTNLRPRSRQLVWSAIESPLAEEHLHLQTYAMASACLNASSLEEERALMFSEKAVDLARTFDDEELLLDALFCRATACWWAGRPHDGLAPGREGVERARRLGDPETRAASLLFYLLCADTVDPSVTDDLFDEAINAAVEAGDRDLQGTLHNNAGNRKLVQGDLAAARLHLEAAIEINEELPPRRLHHPLVNLGWVLWQQHELEQARSFFDEALRVARRRGDLFGVSYALLGIACILTEDERWDEGAEILGAARGTRDTAGGQWGTPEAGYEEECLEKLRAAVGDDAFEASFMSGRSNFETLATELSRR